MTVAVCFLIAGTTKGARYDILCYQVSVSLRGKRSDRCEIQNEVVEVIDKIGQTSENK